MKKILLLAAAIGLWLPLGRAYTPEGPVGNGGDAWQTSDTGFGPTRDTVAPKNLGEEYRQNIPVMYYACDDSFLGYFGSYGQAAIDNAFVTMNSFFTNNPTGIKTGVDGYSLNLSEFPLNSRHLNYQAQALGLMDIKSLTLGLMMGQLGLADPTYYVWNIHDEYHVGNVACPVGQEYLIVQRNFDYISSPLNQLVYSPYINNVLYTYDIIEDCAAPPTPWRWAQPVAVDLEDDPYTPLASGVDYGTDWGVYFTGLTRDDAAGLRHLMSASTIRWESPSADSLQYLITTNTSVPGVVFPPYISGGTNFLNGTNTGYYIFNGTTNGGYGYGDLAAFLAFVRTNPPAVVQAAYPGVDISSWSYTAVTSAVPTIISYYTNAPIGSPYGSPPVLVVRTNYTEVFQFLYNYVFANIFTNHATTGNQLLVTVSVGSPVGSPYGSPGITNTTTRKIPQFMGDFFVLPLFYTNVCPIDILPYGVIPTVLATTNVLTVAATNTTATNLTSYTYLVSYFTNYSYVIQPVNCQALAPTPGLYEGIQKIKFIGSAYDSWFGQYFQPITNNYTLNYVTNWQPQVQYFQRIVTTPDYVFAAADQVAGPNGLPTVTIESHGLTFDQNNIPAGSGLAGPGTIVGQSKISFAKGGPVYYNAYADTLNGTSYFTEQPGSDVSDQFYSEYFVWASFDGTTNTPVVYPNSTSIDQLSYQILVQVSPTTVPNGHNGAAYHAVIFTATSGFFAQPFSWSAANLPPGLYLTSNANNTATLAGTPTQSGTYTFNLALTDNLGRSVQWEYSITIQ